MIFYGLSSAVHYVYSVYERLIEDYRTDENKNNDFSK